MPELTKAQIKAVNRLLKWSTIPNSTLVYAAAMVEEGERTNKMPSKCSEELEQLGLAMLVLGDAFGWKPIPEI